MPASPDLPIQPSAPGARRPRTAQRICEIVGAAEELGWDRDKPRTLDRARRLAWNILWARHPETAALVYGRVGSGGPEGPTTAAPAREDA